MWTRLDEFDLLKGKAAKTPDSPVDAFYEWDHRPGKNKQANLFTRVDGDPLLLAGLFEYWRAPDDKESDLTVTCTIITTEPNDDMDEIHNRKPLSCSNSTTSTRGSTLMNTRQTRGLFYFARLRTARSPITPSVSRWATSRTMVRISSSRFLTRCSWVGSVLLHPHLAMGVQQELAAGFVAKQGLELTSCPM
jgi:hypothetical protein